MCNYEDLICTLEEHHKILSLIRNTKLQNLLNLYLPRFWSFQEYSTCKAFPDSVYGIIKEFVEGCASRELELWVRANAGFQLCFQSSPGSHQRWASRLEDNRTRMIDWRVQRIPTFIMFIICAGFEVILFGLLRISRIQYEQIVGTILGWLIVQFLIAGLFSKSICSRPLTLSLVSALCFVFREHVHFSLKNTLQWDASCL